MTNDYEIIEQVKPRSQISNKSPSTRNNGKQTMTKPTIRTGVFIQQGPDISTKKLKEKIKHLNDPSNPYALGPDQFKSPKEERLKHEKQITNISNKLVSLLHNRDSSLLSQASSIS